MTKPEDSFFEGAVALALVAAAVAAALGRAFGAALGAAEAFELASGAVGALGAFGFLGAGGTFGAFGALGAATDWRFDLRFSGVASFSSRNFCWPRAPAGAGVAFKAMAKISCSVRPKSQLPRMASRGKPCASAVATTPNKPMATLGMKRLCDTLRMKPPVCLEVKSMPLRRQNNDVCVTIRKDKELPLHVTGSMYSQ